MAERALIQAPGSFGTSARMADGEQLGKIITEGLSKVATANISGQLMADRKAAKESAAIEKESSLVLADIKLDYEAQKASYPWMNANEPTSDEWKDFHSKVKTSQTEKYGLLSQKDQATYNTFHAKNMTKGAQLTHKEGALAEKTSLPSLVFGLTGSDAKSIKTGIDNLYDQQSFGTFTKAQMYSMYSKEIGSEITNRLLNKEFDGKTKEEVMSEYPGLGGFMSEIKDDTITSPLVKALGYVTKDHESYVNTESANAHNSLSVDFSKLITDTRNLDSRGQKDAVNDFIENNTDTITTLDDADKAKFDTLIQKGINRALATKDAETLADNKKATLIKIKDATSMKDIRDSVGKSGLYSITENEAVKHWSTQTIDNAASDLAQNVYNNTSGKAWFDTIDKDIYRAYPSIKASLLEMAGKIDTNFVFQKDKSALASEIASGNYTGTTVYANLTDKQEKDIYQSVVNNSINNGDYRQAIKLDNASTESGKIERLNSLNNHIETLDVSSDQSIARATRAFQIFNATKDTYNYPEKTRDKFTTYSAIAQTLGYDLSTPGGLSSLKNTLDNPTDDKVSRAEIYKQYNTGVKADAINTMAATLAPYIGANRAVEYADNWYESNLIDGIPAKLFGATGDQGISDLKDEIAFGEGENIGIQYVGNNNTWIVENDGVLSSFSNRQMKELMERGSERRLMESHLTKAIDAAEGTLPEDTDKDAIVDIVDLQIDQIAGSRNIELNQDQRVKIRLNILKHAKDTLRK